MKDNRELPQNLEVEQALLGAMLMCGKGSDLEWTLDDVRQSVGPDCFIGAYHSAIYRAILDTADSGEPIELYTVEPRLHAILKEPPKDCRAYMIELAESFADLASALHYAGIVREAANKRDLIRLADRLRNEAFAPLTKSADLCEAVEQQLAAVRNGHSQGRAGPVVRRYSEIAKRNLEWLWPGRLPLGKFVLLGGKGGTGKSYAGVEFASILSRGGTWPNGEAGPTAETLLITCEDDPEDTVRERIDRCGGNPERIIQFEGIRPPGGDTDDVVLFRMDEHHRFLDDTLERNPRIKLVIVDPLGAFYGSSVNSHIDAEVRSTLGPIVKMAQRHRVCVLGIAHVGKANNPGCDAIERILGSVGIANAARVAYMTFGDKADDDRRMMLCAKWNLNAKRPDGLAFRIGDDGVAWKGPVEITADEANQPEQGKARAAPAREAAEAFLRGVLANGEADSAEIRKNADAAGITKDAIYRAKEALNLDYRQDGKRVLWSLPDATPQEKIDTNTANTANGSHYSHDSQLF